MTYQPRNRKAPWYRAKFGEKPKRRVFKPIRKTSRDQSRRLRIYHARVKVWKRDKICAAGGLFFINGKAIRFCSGSLPHKCDDCHHAKAKAGHLLMDERYWIPVCREAHTNIREHPIEARAAGFYIGAWQHAEKATV